MGSTKVHGDSRPYKRPRLRLRYARHPSGKCSCGPSLRSISSLPNPARSQGFRILHLAPSMASTFHGPIDGQHVIPGTYTAAGGTTNFNFGGPPAQGELLYYPKDSSTQTGTKINPPERASLSRRCRLRGTLTSSTDQRSSRGYATSARERARGQRSWASAG